MGRYTYAIGGNEEAALLSGVNVKIYKMVVYGLSGMLSGLAAVILTARLNSAQPIADIMIWMSWRPISIPAILDPQKLRT